jgi:branched-chain amino acid transport system ATP-binding protein
MSVVVFLQIKDVTQVFGKLAALTDVSLEINQGELVGLVGPNGSGKSTLFNVLSGFYHPWKGEIFYEGKRITELSPDKIASMGLVRTFQSNILYREATVLENLIRGAYLQAKTTLWQAFFCTKGYIKEEEELSQGAERLLDFWGLSEVRDSLAGKLPHGLQRRLGLAIAFSAVPKLLLLDEPVAGMNKEEIIFVMNRIKDLAEHGITVVLVEHHVKTVVDFCRRLIVLNYGRKIADGKPKDVTLQKNVIEAYLGTTDEGSE